MLKRKPIDTYIRRATAGLPRLERVDTAAEIRVHLLQKTRELMVQGFPREEAEYLAVQEMGPVAATNRALIGHIFTSSLGWAVLSLTVASAITWTYLERHRWIWPETNVHNVDFTLKEVAEFQPLENGSRCKIAFYLPKGTRSLEVAFVVKRSHNQDAMIEGHETGINNPDRNSPIEMNAVLVNDSTKSNGFTTRRIGIKFNSEQVLPTASGSSSSWVTYPSGSEKPSSDDFKTIGTNVSFQRPEPQRLELNKWTLLETLIAEKSRWQKLSGSTSELASIGLRAVQGIAIRANDRLPVEMSRTQLRIQKQNNVWKLVEKPLIGQRRSSNSDSSMDESLQKEIKQLTGNLTRGKTSKP
jgi:hypothetical protein